MADESECRITWDLHEDEEPKDELETQTDTGHVTARHCVTGSEKLCLSYDCKTDSLALQSVYRYARKIRCFLGLENATDDFELAEDNENFAPQNLLVRKDSTDEASNGDKGNDNTTKLIKNEKISEASNEISCSKQNSSKLDEISCSKPNSYQLDDISFSKPDCFQLDEISESGLERGYRSSTVLYVGQHESDSNLSEEGSWDISVPKIFISEVNLIVEDCRSGIVVSPGEVSLGLVSCLADSVTVMDESLIHENGAVDAGLILNDADRILKDETEVLPAYVLKGKCPTISDDCMESRENFPDKSDNCMESGKNITDNSDDCKESGENIPDNSDDCNTSGEKVTTETVKHLVVDNAVDVNRKESLTVVKEKLIENELDEKVLDDKNEQIDNSEEISERNLEAQKNDLNEKKNLEALKESEGNGEPFLHLAKEKQANDVKKIDKTLRAYIQYDNEEPKKPNNIGGLKNDFLRKDSIFSDDTVCGIGIFRPRWLQPYANAKVYVILYSIIGILHGSYYSYLIGTLSTLEKRFAFKSKISGVIMIADEATPLLLGVIIGYYAGKANRPRMVALGMLLSALCCFCSSLPYFIYGPVQHLTTQNILNNRGPEFCYPGNNSCDSEDRPPTLPAVLFLVLGSFLKGFGNLAYYAIGLAYLDDNSDKKSTPIYLAIALALRLLGPLVGFLMSSLFLKLYENPVDDPGYGPDDPRWIGAWWIGFFLQGVLLVIFTLPIALFPRRLPGQKTVEKNTAPSIGDGWRQILSDLLSALKRLGKNPVFILLIINTNMKIFGQFGHSIMLPKYMENQFRLSASQASLYSGATSITFIMVATVFGGFIIWKFRPRLKMLLCGMIISEIIMCIGFLVLMIPRCQPADMVNFGMNDDGLILNSVCNKDCECSTTSFTPFCGPDAKTYFSPCYAGCTHEFNSSKKKEFGNCSCLAATVDDDEVTTITEGFCPDDTCWSQTLAYLIILLIMVSVSNAFTVVHTMILLRSVHPNDKSIALGTFETFICLFGFIPFPITIGALVDSACLVWEESCGETGNCWFYDMNKFAYMLHGVSATFCFLSVLCCASLYFLSSRVRDLYADEDEEKEYVGIKLDTVSGCETKL